MQQHGHVAYQIKGNHEYSNMVTHVLLAKGQNIFWGEIGHIAYQIKENPECSNMVANIFPADPPSPPLQPGGWGQMVKIQLFQNIMMLRIILKDLTNAATW